MGDRKNKVSCSPKKYPPTDNVNSQACAPLYQLDDACREEFNFSIVSDSTNGSSPMLFSSLRGLTSTRSGFKPVSPQCDSVMSPEIPPQSLQSLLEQDFNLTEPRSSDSHNISEEPLPGEVQKIASNLPCQSSSDLMSQSQQTVQEDSQVDLFESQGVLGSETSTQLPNTNLPTFSQAGGTENYSLYSQGVKSKKHTVALEQEADCFTPHKVNWSTESAVNIFETTLPVEITTKADDKALDDCNESTHSSSTIPPNSCLQTISLNHPERLPQFQVNGRTNPKESKSTKSLVDESKKEEPVFSSPESSVSSCVFALGNVHNKLTDQSCREHAEGSKSMTFSVKARSWFGKKKSDVSLPLQKEPKLKKSCSSRRKKAMQAGTQSNDSVNISSTVEYNNSSQDLFDENVSKEAEKCHPKDETSLSEMGINRTVPSAVASQPVAMKAEIMSWKLLQKYSPQKALSGAIKSSGSQSKRFSIQADDKELQPYLRLVLLYDKMLEKLDGSTQTDGKKELKKFKEILTQLRRGLDTEEKKIFSLSESDSQKTGGNFKEKEKLRLHKHQSKYEILQKAVQKHEQLKNRVLFIQATKEKSVDNSDKKSPLATSAKNMRMSGPNIIIHNANLEANSTSNTSNQADNNCHTGTNLGNESLALDLDPLAEKRTDESEKHLLPTLKVDIHKQTFASKKQSFTKNKFKVIPVESSLNNSEEMCLKAVPVNPELMQNMDQSVTDCNLNLHDELCLKSTDSHQKVAAEIFHGDIMMKSQARSTGETGINIPDNDMIKQKDHHLNFVDQKAVGFYISSGFPKVKSISEPVEVNNINTNCDIFMENETRYLNMFSTGSADNDTVSNVSPYTKYNKHSEANTEDLKVDADKDQGQEKANVRLSSLELNHSFQVERISSSVEDTSKDQNKNAGSALDLIRAKLSPTNFPSSFVHSVDDFQVPSDITGHQSEIQLQTMAKKNMEIYSAPSHTPENCNTSSVSDKTIYGNAQKKMDSEEYSHTVQGNTHKMDPKELAICSNVLVADEVELSSNCRQKQLQPCKVSDLCQYQDRLLVKLPTSLQNPELNREFKGQISQASLLQLSGSEKLLPNEHEGDSNSQQIYDKTNHISLSLKPRHQQLTKQNNVLSDGLFSGNIITMNLQTTPCKVEVQLPRSNDTKTEELCNKMDMHYNQVLSADDVCHSDQDKSSGSKGKNCPMDPTIQKMIRNLTNKSSNGVVVLSDQELTSGGICKGENREDDRSKIFSDSQTLAQSVCNNSVSMGNPLLHRHILQRSQMNSNIVSPSISPQTLTQSVRPEHYHNDVINTETNMPIKNSYMTSNTSCGSLVTQTLHRDILERNQMGRKVVSSAVASQKLSPSLMPEKYRHEGIGTKTNIQSKDLLADSKPKIELTHETYITPIFNSDSHPSSPSSISTATTSLFPVSSREIIKRMAQRLKNKHQVPENKGQSGALELPNKYATDASYNNRCVSPAVKEVPCSATNMSGSAKESFKGNISGGNKITILSNRPTLKSNSGSCGQTHCPKLKDGEYVMTYVQPSEALKQKQNQYLILKAGSTNPCAKASLSQETSLNQPAMQMQHCQLLSSSSKTETVSIFQRPVSSQILRASTIPINISSSQTSICESSSTMSSQLKLLPLQNRKGRKRTFQNKSERGRRSRGSKQGTKLSKSSVIASRQITNYFPSLPAVESTANTPNNTISDSNNKIYQSKSHKDIVSRNFVTMHSQASEKKGHELPALNSLIRSLHKIKLIANEELNLLGSDFPDAFWDENFSDIRMSKHILDSVDVWE